MFSPVSPSSSKKPKPSLQQKKTGVVNNNNGIKGQHQALPSVPSKSSMDDWKALEMINGGNKNAFGLFITSIKVIFWQRFNIVYVVTAPSQKTS